MDALISELLETSGSFTISDYALYPLSLQFMQDQRIVERRDTRGFLVQHPSVTEEALEIYFEALRDAD